MSAQLEEMLDDMIIGLAQKVLYEIVSLEYEDLASRNPSFAELADQCKKVLVSIKPSLSDEAVKAKVITKFLELVEALESIAISIAELDEKLLVDNITHLEEFLTINGTTKET